MQRTARVVTTTVLAALALAATLAAPNPSQATPLDLSGFTAIENKAGSVSEAGGTITFVESPDDAALYFNNFSFSMPGDAGSLSFDYVFRLDGYDPFDALVVNAGDLNTNYAELFRVDTAGTGHVSLDFSSFAGQTITFNWGLLWGGDMDGTITASAVVSNIDLAQTGNASPVPEPATMLLMATGLAGLYGARRKRADNPSRPPLTFTTPEFGRFYHDTNSQTKHKVVPGKMVLVELSSWHKFSIVFPLLRFAN